MKIRALLHVVNSKRDMYGNCYFVAEVTNTRTGKQTKFTTHSRSNVEADLKRVVGLEWGEFVTTEEQVPIREYNRLAKDLPHDADKEIEALFNKARRS